VLEIRADVERPPRGLGHQRVERLRQRPPRVDLEAQPLAQPGEPGPARGDLGVEAGAALRRQLGAGRLLELRCRDGPENVRWEVADGTPGPVPGERVRVKRKGEREREEEGEEEGERKMSFLRKFLKRVFSLFLLFRTFRPSYSPPRKTTARNRKKRKKEKLTCLAGS